MVYGLVCVCVVWTVVRHAGVIQEATIFFQDWFGDRDGSWCARACVDARAEMACVRGRDGLVSMGAWCVYGRDAWTWMHGIVRFMFRKYREMARRVRGTSGLKAPGYRRDRGT